MKKSIILILALTTISLNFTGCSSAKKTFGSSEYNKSYDEKLTAFHSNLKQTNLTFIGEKYNYVFSNAKTLTQLLKNQKLLALNPSNMSLNIRVKEYKSSIVTLTLFSHFEKSKLNKEQIKWLGNNGFSLEQRASFGGKKSESSRPPKVATFVLSLKLQGERKKRKGYAQAELLSPSISLEIAEHITL